MDAGSIPFENLRNLRNLWNLRSAWEGREIYPERKNDIEPR